MFDLFLDLHDRLKTMDFITERLAYVPITARKKLEDHLQKIEEEEETPIEEVAELARTVGKKSWAARQALKHHLNTQEGCDLEWRKVVAATSDSTAHILERFRHGTACKALDEVLEHEESASAFRDTERREIAEVRKQVHHDIWQEKHKVLDQEMTKFEKQLASITKRLTAMRELAADAPWIQDEVLSKLERFEDRLYFAGEVLDPEILDEELKLYREEKELPAREG